MKNLRMIRKDMNKMAVIQQMEMQWVLEMDENKDKEWSM